MKVYARPKFTLNVPLNGVVYCGSIFAKIYASPWFSLHLRPTSRVARINGVVKTTGITYSLQWAKF